MPRLLRRLQPHHGHGFTLMELLLSLVMGGVLLAAISQVLVSHLRASVQQVEIQRLRISWRKFQTLLSTEVAEAVHLSTSASDVRACGFNRSADRVILILFVPIYDPSLSPTDAPSSIVDSRITYYQRERDGVPEVRRCGPPIRPDGSLDPDGSLYIGIDGAPGSLVLEGIDVSTAQIENRRATIGPRNPIENAMTPFTAHAQVVRSD